MIRWIHTHDKHAFVETSNQEIGLISIAFRAGNFYENEDCLGVTHLIEHLVFRRLYDTGQLREIELTGSMVSATTNKDYVEFHLVAPLNSLRKTSEILISQVLNLVINSRDIREEKNIVLRELDQYEGSASNILKEYLTRLVLVPELEELTKAREREVKVLGSSAVKRFHREFFTSKNAFLIGVGPTVVGNILTQLATKFDLNTSTNIRPPVKVINPLVEKKRKNGRVGESLIGLTYVSDSAFDVTQVILGLLAIQLVEKLTSDLFVSLRHSKGLVYDISSHVTTLFQSNSFLSFILQTPHVKQVKCLKALNSTIAESILSTSEEYLSSLKSGYKTRALMLTDINQIYTSVLQSVLYERSEFARKRLTYLENITTKNYLDTAQVLLAPHNQGQVIIE